MDLGEPVALPEFKLPEPLVLPRPVLEVPHIELPSYKPLVIPPEGLRPPAGVKSDSSKKEERPTPTPSPPPPIKPPEIRYVEIPATDIEIPLPTNEILATAGSTAVVSVAAGLAATSIFKKLVSLMKPVIKKVCTKFLKEPKETS